jgi:hypothetical protein
MILAKINPVGIDVDIALIQKAIHDAFDVKWSEGQNTINGVICYPRCYVNPKRRNMTNVYDSKVIEYFDASTEDTTEEYIDSNMDYKDVLDGEENRMIILTDYDIFPVNNLQNFESSLIECIFIVNLNKTHPGIKHRADEEVRIEVKKVLARIPNVSIHKTVRTINKVFGDAKYSTALDMQPLHSFKIILSLNSIGSNRNCK